MTGVTATSNRHDVKAQAVDVATAANDARLAGVVVSYGDPDPNVVGDPDEIVIVGRIVGSQDAATMGTSATGRNDRYQIECFIGVRGLGDLRKVGARCQEIIDGLGAVWFASPRLDRQPNPIGNVTLGPGRLDGPNASPGNGTTALATAFINIEVNCALRGA